MKCFDKLYARVLDNIGCDIADRYKHNPVEDRGAFLFEVIKAVNEANIYRKIILWLFEPYKGHAVDEIYFFCLYVLWVEVNFNENR